MTELRLWHFGDQQLFEELAEAFHQVNPNIRVKPEFAGSKFEILLKLAKAMSQDEAPELAMIYSEAVPAFAQVNALHPLTGLLESFENRFVEDGISDDLFNCVRHEGDLWGMPYTVGSYALFCNLDLFEAAGVDLPTNWEELAQASTALTLDTDGDGQIDQWGYQMCTYQYPLFIWQAGGDILTDDLEAVRFHDEAGVEALRFYTDLYLKLRVNPPHIHFERGDLAMKLSVTSNIRRYEKAGINFKVIPLPGHRRRMTRLGASNGLPVFVALQTLEDKFAASGEFLRWLGSTETLLDLTLKTDSLPISKSVFQHPKYQQFLETNPHHRTMAEHMIEDGMTTPTIPETMEIKEIIASEVQHPLKRLNRPDRKSVV